MRKKLSPAKEQGLGTTSKHRFRWVKYLSLSDALRDAMVTTTTPRADFLAINEVADYPGDPDAVSLAIVGGTLGKDAVALACESDGQTARYEDGDLDSPTFYVGREYTDADVQAALLKLSASERKLLNLPEPKVKPEPVQEN